MNALTISPELVQQTKDLLNAVRGSSIKIGENLYNIKENLSKETNWADFIRDEFDISEGFASKLMTIHRVLVLEGGVSQEKLEGIDGEKLYLATKLEGTPEEKVAKASTLTRRELKEERNDEQPHEHIPVSICKTCSIRL
jgi:hypothetical protein